MSCRLSLLLSLVAFSCLLGASRARPADDMPPRPTRPERFNSQQEVNDYVKKLQEYYSIIGRGRYGKRTYQLLPHIPRAYLPLPDRIDSDIYDFLAQYE